MLNGPKVHTKRNLSGPEPRNLRVITLICDMTSSTADLPDITIITDEKLMTIIPCHTRGNSQSWWPNPLTRNEQNNWVRMGTSKFTSELRITIINKLKITRLGCYVQWHATLTESVPSERSALYSIGVNIIYSERVLVHSFYSQNLRTVQRRNKITNNQGPAWHLSRVVAEVYRNYR